MALQPPWQWSTQTRPSWCCSVQSRDRHCVWVCVHSMWSLPLSRIRLVSKQELQKSIWACWGSLKVSKDLTVLYRKNTNCSNYCPAPVSRRCRLERMPGEQLPPHWNSRSAVLNSLAASFSSLTQDSCKLTLTAQVYNYFAWPKQPQCNGESGPGITGIFCLPAQVEYTELHTIMNHTYIMYMCYEHTYLHHTLWPGVAFVGCPCILYKYSCEHLYFTKKNKTTCSCKVLQ